MKISSYATCAVLLFLITACTKSPVEKCKKGKGVYCLNHAESMLKKGDLDQALEFFQIACRNRMGPGCLKAARMMEERKMPVTEIRGTYRMGCNYGVKEACDRYSKLMME